MTDVSVLNSKRVVYVGGLADEVTIPLLRACMIPFGPIHSIDMVRPVQYVAHQVWCLVVVGSYIPNWDFCKNKNKWDKVGHWTQWPHMRLFSSCHFISILSLLFRCIVLNFVLVPGGNLFVWHDMT